MIEVCQPQWPAGDDDNDEEEDNLDIQKNDVDANHGAMTTTKIKIHPKAMMARITMTVKIKIHIKTITKRMITMTTTKTT